MSYTKGNIAWVDVETDSLDASTGHLLEIAVVVTDAELNILDEEGFHAVVRYPMARVEALRDLAVPFVQEMHDKTGLWEKLCGPEALEMHEVDRQVVKYLAQFGDPRVMPVAGNSVRLDMNFMDRHLPKTAGFLDYHMRDVSTVAGLASDWYDLPWFEKTNDHTAKHDIRESIRELKHYREAIFRPQWTDELQEFATRLAALGSQMREDENKVLIAEAVERIFGGGPPVSETVEVTSDLVETAVEAFLAAQASDPDGPLLVHSNMRAALIAVLG